MSLASPARPSISLIMTVLNEQSSLAQFLDSIAGQAQLPDEIVVVDGGSRDGTMTVLENWTPPVGVDLVVRQSVGANISAGRNEAIRLARSQWVAVADAGTEMDASWLEALSSQMRSDVAVVSGFFEPLYGGTLMQQAIGATITPLRGEIQPSSFLPSSRSIAFRKDAWEEVGGYPEWLDYCEDLVFDLALRAAGYQFVFESAAIARWDARPTLRSYAKQYYRYARGDGKAGLWARRHTVRYIAYIAGLLLAGLALSLRSPLIATVLAGAAATYSKKFFDRVRSRRGALARPAMAAALVLPIVIVGDLAKMAGYPAGIVWRARTSRRLESAREA